MAQTISIRRIENHRELDAFITFPWKVYRDDPNWVPPLLSMRKEVLDKKKNPAWDYLEGDYYGAWRGTELVGTIAAFVNHRHNEFQNEHVAWFGFFETINDPAVGRALLETAVEWAKSRGYDAIRGPQSFTTHEECGLLIDGFEQPIMLMPYNPPYYQGMIESSGFGKVMDTYSFYYNWELLRESRGPERIRKIIERVKRKTNFTVRPINRKNLNTEFRYFKEIYNSAWDKNWGFVPMTERELDALVKNLGMFFDPRLACFVESDGVPIAFMIGVPDFNQVLKRAGARPGIPEPITLLKALWHWKLNPKIDTFRIPLMGVKEEYRKHGVDILLYDYFLNELPKLSTNYQHMDSGWILETNQDMIGILQSLGAKIYRTYRFYQQGLK